MEKYSMDPQAPVRARAQASTGFLQAVFSWMTLGLALTGVVAWLTANNDTMVRTIVGNQILFFGLILAELGLVVALSAALPKLSYSTAGMLFLLYSGLNGLTMSVILLAYTATSIAAVFFITAGTFGAAALYGATTKRDLTSMGSLAFMGLIGIILASIVNMFLQSSALHWIISYVGVAVFVGLTAYDMQKLQQIHASGTARGEEGAKLSILGALRLYLDFVNLFLMLLRIFGNRR